MKPPYPTHIKPVDLATVLTALYASEINCSISSIWDSGWDVKLGDELNGFLAESNFQTVEEAAAFLHGAALIHFPKSDYAKRRNAVPGRG
jgi:hypothetical protein